MHHVSCYHDGNHACGYLLRLVQYNCNYLQLHTGTVHNGLQRAEFQATKYGGGLVNPLLVFVLHGHLLDLYISNVGLPGAAQGLSPVNDHK